MKNEPNENTRPCAEKALEKNPEDDSFRELPPKPCFAVEKHQNDGYEITLDRDILGLVEIRTA